MTNIQKYLMITKEELSKYQGRPELHTEAHYQFHRLNQDLQTPSPIPTKELALAGNSSPLTHDKEELKKCQELVNI